MPTGHADEPGCQYLVDGAFDGGLTVSALVQAFTRRVEREGAEIVGNVHVEFDIGVGNADIGTLARLFTEKVNDGIFDFVGNKLGMLEVFGIDNGIDGK